MVYKSEVRRFRGFPRIRKDEEKEKGKTIKGKTIFRGSEVQRFPKDSERRGKRKRQNH